MLKDFLKNAAERAGYVVRRRRNRYMQDGLFTVHSDRFRYDPEFRSAYARGVAASDGVDPGFEWRVHVALWAAASCRAVAGDFVECGVNAGFFSSAIMRRLRWSELDKHFYLIDTFAGPPGGQYSPEEVAEGRLSLARKAHVAGSYVTDLERVRANYAEWPNTAIVQGAVPDILPALNISKIAFLHIDMNCAYPEKEALLYFWSRLSPGSFVLLDDYAYFGHHRQAEAIDAVAVTLGTDVLSLPTGQGLIIRR